MASRGTSAAKATDAVSTVAFRESVDFATEIGMTRTKIQCVTEAHGTPISILKPHVTELLGNAERCINAWHAYLNIDGLHSEGCLRAAFTTVSRFTDGLSGLCELAEAVHRKSPDYLPGAVFEGLTSALERLEDIQESLAVLIDDEARTELRGILVEAGIDGRVLDRKDAEDRPKTAD